MRGAGKLFAMGPLVSATWLLNRLHDPGTVILDATLPAVGVAPPVDTRAKFQEQHIPGAVFFDIEQLSEQATSLPHMLPSPEAFSRAMSALGVGDGMTIVVYEQEGVYSAPRARWMLRTLGAKEVYLLDGDLRAWRDAGLPVETGFSSRKPASFHGEVDQAAVQDFAQLRQLIAERAQILDARSEGRFRGTLPEPRPGLASGHMPGATNVPYTALVDNGRLRPAAELRALFDEKGVNTSLPITTTCGSGVTAAVVSLALEIVGAPQVKLYDGSWAEYAQHPEAVIERSS
jgi:thiosulfate/3-mercaptopyruvate sulfurtransferase